MIPEEQTILVNWYNSLTDKGRLRWDVENDLCGQEGVSCQDVNSYQVLRRLYFFFFFLRKKKNLEKKIGNRYLVAQGLAGTIPPEFGGLSNLRRL